MTPKKLCQHNATENGCRSIENDAKMARVGRPSTFILHSLGTRAGTGPRANVLDDVRAADSAPLPPQKIAQLMLN